MNYFEENVDQLRNIINELYSYVGKVGEYSNLATEIEIACSNLTKAVDEYKKQIEEDQ